MGGDLDADEYEVEDELDDQDDCELVEFSMLPLEAVSLDLIPPKALSDLRWGLALLAWILIGISVSVFEEDETEAVLIGLNAELVAC